MLLEDTLLRGFEKLNISADARAMERFRVYYEYLEEKNAVMNLTAISGEKDVAELHFLDSAALLNMLLTAPPYPEGEDTWRNSRGISSPRPRTAAEPLGGRAAFAAPARQSYGEKEVKHRTHPAALGPKLNHQRVRHHLRLHPPPAA